MPLWESFTGIPATDDGATPLGANAVFAGRPPAATQAAMVGYAVNFRVREYAGLFWPWQIPLLESLTDPPAMIGEMAVPNFPGLPTGGRTFVAPLTRSG